MRRSIELTSGKTCSCGCLADDVRKEIGRNNLIDLTGMEFGDLTVLERYINDAGDYKTKWLCQCSCGKKIVVLGGHLVDGHTQSCGCGHMRSKGEKMIAQILSENGVQFQSQYKVSTLKSKRGYPLSFDFAVFENGTLDRLIEYQGYQHTHPVDYFGGEERFKRQQENDNIKREYAKDNNIPLIEIHKPYSKISYHDLCI